MLPRLNSHAQRCRRVLKSNSNSGMVPMQCLALNASPIDSAAKQVVQYFCFADHATARSTLSSHNTDTRKHHVSYPASCPQPPLACIHTSTLCLILSLLRHQSGGLHMSRERVSTNPYEAAPSLKLLVKLRRTRTPPPVSTVSNTTALTMSANSAAANCPLKQAAI